MIQRIPDVLAFTLDNPGRGNEVTGAMLDAMLAELRAEASTPVARVLRIRARGKVFCSGRERTGRDAASLRKEAERLIEFQHTLRTSPVISIAEVQGDALGFGFGLAIACDFALVAENASLALPDMRSGLAPSDVAAYLGEYALPRVAFPLVLFGDPISPVRALQVGLISQICAPEELVGEANALVARILRLDSAAVRRCKEFFSAAQQDTFEQNCRRAVAVLTEDGLARLDRRK
ncbi:MAG TPA: enoyl-CoA hydratase/isomerase family protein [Candidatus Acidoferrum sp.]|nr:enoyl-CoA hydratase/isomerase family protein [Candidatus Acidoferrum sp.]